MDSKEWLGGSDLDVLAGATFDTKRRVESDGELRARILGKLRHCTVTASLDHMDWVVTDAIHTHAPMAVTPEMAKAELARYWLREESKGLGWWARLRFWWRLWRAG